MSTASASRECRKRNGASSPPPAAPTFHRNRRNRVERSTRRQTAAASDPSHVGSFSTMLFGVIAALLAAVPGFVDYSDIRRDHPGKVTATRHMTLNLMVVAIYGINLWLRSSALTESKIDLGPLFLSFIGIGLLSASGYLGGRLVYDEGIAVGRHKRKTPTPQDTLHLSTGYAAKDGETTFVSVPNAEHLRNGETLRVEIDKQVMTIARIENELYAFQEFC